MSLHNLRGWIPLPTRTSSHSAARLVAGDTGCSFCREPALGQISRSFARADVTKHYRLRGLNNRNSSPHSSEGLESARPSVRALVSFLGLSLDLEAVILFCSFQVVFHMHARAYVSLFNFSLLIKTLVVVDDILTIISLKTYLQMQSLSEGT